MSERSLWAYLKRILKRLELQGHLHTFRHTFISAALIADVPEAIVRKWVGHVDHEIMKLYTHIADTASQAAMQRFAEQTGGVPVDGADEEGKTGGDPGSAQSQHGREGKTDGDPGSAHFQHNREENENDITAN